MSQGEPVSPWADGDEPFSQSIDLNEYPKELLRLRRCRSFRADLKHKLEIIMRAHGGWGSGGAKRAAWAIGVHRHTFRQWLNWRKVPGCVAQWERIDSAYDRALETLAKEAARRKR